MILKIGLGGGCHWCTEAVFQKIKGVTHVNQGYIASTEKNNSFSEAVLVSYNSQQINLEHLIKIHLVTHSSTSNHSLRSRYRSAIYTFDKLQSSEAKKIISSIQKQEKNQIITQVLPFSKFNPSRESIQEYYLKHKDAPFCTRYILPKFKVLETNYKELMKKG